MALTKPILNGVSSWDVTKGQTFTFNVIGGDAVVGNTLYILDNSTNTVVYTLTTTSFRYEAVVPANAAGLVNGTYYSAYIVTRNSANETSLNSNTIQFYCYSAPSWSITNITSGAVVGNSSIAPEAVYSQSEGEALNDYTFTLYDASQIQLSTSGVQYTGSTASTYTATYNFFGLEDNTAYYIRATGHTVGGTVIDTGYINFTVSYVQPQTYNVLVVQNNCDEGYITYYSNAIVQEGTSNPSPPVYTADGVDLTTSDSWVKWTGNLFVEGGFTVKAWVVNPNINTTLIQLTDDNNNEIRVEYITNPMDSSQVLAVVWVNDSYFIYSNSITQPSASQVLCFQLRRVGDLYDIVLGVA